MIEIHFMVYKGMAMPILKLLCIFLLTQFASVVARSGIIIQDEDAFCNKTVGVSGFVTSPKATLENRGKPLLCYYKFSPPPTSRTDMVIRVVFTEFKVGRLINATYCENGYIQIIDGNYDKFAHGPREPGKFCGDIQHPQAFISETDAVQIIFAMEKFTGDTYFRFEFRPETKYQIESRYGPNPKLLPNPRGDIIPGTHCDRIFPSCRDHTCFVQSPNYPGIYPRNLHCKYHLYTRMSAFTLEMSNEIFNVDGQSCKNQGDCFSRPVTSNCPNDYIKIYAGHNESSPLWGKFCGHGTFPVLNTGSGSDLFLEFVTSPAGPLQEGGFHFNVETMLRNGEPYKIRNRCHWTLTSDDLRNSGDKIGRIRMEAYENIPSSSCNYLILGNPWESVRLHFPRFEFLRSEVRDENQCGESLTIYDAGGDDYTKIMRKFCSEFSSEPSPETEFISTKNSLFLRYKGRNENHVNSSIHFWAEYTFFNKTDNEGNSAKCTAQSTIIVVIFGSLATFLVCYNLAYILLF